MLCPIITRSIFNFPGGASGKEPTCQCRRLKSHGFNHWVRKILTLEEEMATHSSILDRGAWQATVHRVAQSQTQLKQLSTQYYTVCCTGFIMKLKKGDALSLLPSRIGPVPASFPLFLCVCVSLCFSLSCCLSHSLLV